MRSQVATFAATLLEYPSKEGVIIEIRMSHDPSIIKNDPQSGVKLPLVMRGLVSHVARNEHIGGDKPGRYVSIIGHDFAKIMQIYRVDYIPFTEMGEVAMQEFRFFQYFAPEAASKSMTGNDFAKLVSDKILTPYMVKMTELSNAVAVGAEELNYWVTDSSIDGSVSPQLISTFNDISIYDVLRATLDIGYFNELFVEDTDKAPKLVVRPAPMKDGLGNFIQGSADSIDIPSTDIMNINTSRSDEGVANYYYVTNSSMAMQRGFDLKALAAAGDPKDFYLSDYSNSSPKIYGFRKMQVDTMLGDDLVSYSDSQREKLANADNLLMESWVIKRRKLLAALNRDNAVFESGSLRLRGNEAIKAGIYLNLHRGAEQNYVGEVYAHTVSHEFIPFHGFFTTVQFCRGTGFIYRAQLPSAPAITEIEAQGVM